MLFLAFIFAKSYTKRSIMDVQGPYHQTPLTTHQERFVEIEGIITQTSEFSNWNGYFLQSPYYDASDFRKGRSGGIFVTSESAVTMGDLVTVQGYVFEKYIPHFFEQSDLTKGLTMTMLNEHKVTIDESNFIFSFEEAFKPSMPTSVIFDGPPSDLLNHNRTLDISNGIDYWEALEGMYVKLTDPIVSQSQKYGGIYVYSKSFHTNSNKVGGLTSLPDDDQPEQLLILTKGLPRGSLKDLQVGDALENIFGNIVYERGQYAVYVDAEIGVELKYRRTFQESVPPVRGMRVMSYNVFNLDASQTGRVEQVAEDILSIGASVVGLQEVVDDPGQPGQSNALLDALCDHLDGFQYTYVRALPGQDGGKPNANIKQALLYHTSMFEPIPQEESPDASCDTTNPCRIEPFHEAFVDSRKPLVAKLRHVSGQLYTFVVVHLKSLRNGGMVWGRYQPPAIGSELLRRTQVAIVNQYAMKQKRVIVLGDFNDQPFHSALSLMELEDAHAELPVKEQYSYVFNGQSQKIDYIFTKGVNVQNARIAHLNTPFVEKEQHSDHDAVYVDIQ